MEGYSLINGREISNTAHIDIIKAFLSVKPGISNWKVVASKRYVPSVRPDEIDSVYLSTSKTRNKRRYKLIRFESIENGQKIYYYLRRPSMVLNGAFYITEKMISYYRIYSDKRWPLIYNVWRFLANKRGNAPKAAIYRVWRKRANEWHDKFMKFTPHYADIYSQKLYYTKNKSVYVDRTSEAQKRKYEVERRGIERMRDYLKNVNSHRRAGDSSTSSSAILEIERPYFEHLTLADESVSFDIWVDFAKEYLAFFTVPLNVNILEKLCQIYRDIRDHRERYTDMLSKLDYNRYGKLASLFFNVYFNKRGKQIKKYPRKVRTSVNHLIKFN